MVHAIHEKVAYPEHVSLPTLLFAFVLATDKLAANLAVLVLPAYHLLPSSRPHLFLNL